MNGKICHGIDYLTQIFPNQLININDAKFRLFKQYKLDYISFQFYKYFKNKVTSMLKQAKKMYSEEKFDRCSGD